jgi:hypothetical protein
MYITINSMFDIRNSIHDIHLSYFSIIIYIYIYIMTQMDVKHILWDTLSHLIVPARRAFYDVL